MIEAGVELQQVQRILGHANLDTTLRYTHLTQKGATNSDAAIALLMKSFHIEWERIR